MPVLILALTPARCQGVGAAMAQDRVVVLTALGSVPPTAHDAHRVRVVRRPAAIADVVRVVRRTLGRA